MAVGFWRRGTKNLAEGLVEGRRRDVVVCLRREELWKKADE